MAFEPSERSETLAADFSEHPDLKRRWLYIVPAVFVTYSLAYVDRANYGFGAAAGLAETLHISSAQSALLGSLFFFGYFVFQIPGAAQPLSLTCGCSIRPAKTPPSTPQP
jgi:sugar phosphate permease